MHVYIHVYSIKKLTNVTKNVISRITQKRKKEKTQKFKAAWLHLAFSNVVKFYEHIKEDHYSPS